MIELSPEQTRMLRSFVSRAANFLKTVECADGFMSADRDLIIEDAKHWTRILLEKQQCSPPSAYSENG